MTDVLFRFDVDAAPKTVLEAVKTSEGVKGFWTSRADVPAEVGGTLKPEFAIAPLHFTPRLEQAGEPTVVGPPQPFPPPWVGPPCCRGVTPTEGHMSATSRSSRRAAALRSSGAIKFRCTSPRADRPCLLMPLPLSRDTEARRGSISVAITWYSSH